MLLCVNCWWSCVISSGLYTPLSIPPPLRKRYFSLHQARVSSRYGLGKKIKEIKTNGQWLAPEPQTYILKTYHPLRSPSPNILKITFEFFFRGWGWGVSVLVHETEAFPPPLLWVWRCIEMWMRLLTRHCFDGCLTFRLCCSDVTETDCITSDLKLQVQSIFLFLPVAAVENSSQKSNMYCV